MADVDKYDIIQITDENHAWFACLIIVSDIKPSRVQGYITLPTNDAKPNGHAYIRLKSEQYVKVGRAEIVVK